MIVPAVRGTDVPGVTRVALPIGVNAIDSVNMYILADGDKVTVVDCGVWRPDLPDGGLRRWRPAWRAPDMRCTTFQGDRHACAHRSLRAGRPGDGADRRRPVDARHDRPGLREVPAPRHRAARRKDTYADHGIPEDERVTSPITSPAGCRICIRWSRRPPGCAAASRSRSAATVGKSFTLPDIRSAMSACGRRRRGLLLSGDHLLPGITPPVTFERGFDADPMRSYMQSLQLIRERRPQLVYPGHGRPFGDAVGRIEAIMRNKVRRLSKIARRSRPVRARSARSPTSWWRRDPRPPAAIGDQRDAGPYRLSALVRV